MNKLYPVYTLKNECHDCYKCVRECHIKAIKVQDGSASVINDKCIACGHCVKVCPSGAKKVRNDIDKVKTLFTAQKQVYVSLAPSWAGIYDLTPAQMVAVLKKLGFYAVSETALGAQQVSIKTAEMLNNGESGLYISSACPVIVDYIRYYKPEFAKYITPLASPALTHAKILKEKYGDKISIVFIGPCIGKKNEADSNPDFIDTALTFEELNYWISEEFINISEIEINNNDKFVPEEAFEGALYPVEGGMNDTIKEVGVNEDVTLVKISGLENFDNFVEGLNTNSLNNKVFVEALSCETGCINGPCIANKKAGLSITTDILSKIKHRDKIPTVAETVFKKEYASKPIIEDDIKFADITNALKKIGKHTPEDELNCGGCGYSTCRDMAKALISGDAEPSMCISYMRKIAMRKAAAMLRCMPSAIVMVDKELNIVEANDAFMKMFCGDMYDIFASRKEGLSGASLDRIISFSDIFSQLLKSGGDIHKSHYQVKNKLYDISAFTIEDGEIVGAVITDVTKAEIDREKIAAKAREVITKNITKVQEIACLLGEHMVETEVLLNSIAEDYSNDNSDDDGEEL